MKSISKDKHLLVPTILVLIMNCLMLVLAFEQNRPLDYEPLIRYSFVVVIFILIVVNINNQNELWKQEQIAPEYKL